MNIERCIKEMGEKCRDRGLLPELQNIAIKSPPTILLAPPAKLPWRTASRRTGDRVLNVVGGVSASVRAGTATYSSGGTAAPAGLATIERSGSLKAAATIGGDDVVGGTQ